MATTLASFTRNGVVLDKPHLKDAKPFNDFCVVRLHTPRKTEGDILLPDKSETYKVGVWQVGTVLAVGPGELTISGERKQLTTQVGDRVLFDLRSAQIPASLDIINTDGEYSYLFVREQNMLGKL